MKKFCFCLEKRLNNIKVMYKIANLSYIGSNPILAFVYTNKNYTHLYIKTI